MLKNSIKKYLLNKRLKQILSTFLKEGQKFRPPEIIFSNKCLLSHHHYWVSYFFSGKDPSPVYTESEKEEEEEEGEGEDPRPAAVSKFLGLPKVCPDKSLAYW